MTARFVPARWRWLLFAALSLALGSAALFLRVEPSVADGPPPLVFQVPDGDRIAKKGPDEVIPPVCAIGGRDRQPTMDLPFMPQTTCTNGMAGIYPCQRVDLQAFMPLSTVGGGGSIQASSVWGWTDTLTGREYALLGLTNGTSFVDISDPDAPIFLGKLPTHTGTSSWRELKVYGNYVYIVSDLNGSHGVQIFDLTQLRNVPNPPVTFSETAHYGNAGSIHNIVVNQESGYAYAVGTSSGPQTCSGGLHMINIQNPTSPTFAGCFANDGYTHDAQCVMYNGPDADYQGHELCVASNEDTVTVVDVTNKSQPRLVSRTGYPRASYTHQSWLTEDQAYMVLDDELDESFFGNNSRTYIWDMRDMDNPVLINTYTSTSRAIDHNQYVRDGYVYQANYRSGLRVLDASRIEAGQLAQVGFFDVYPADDAPSFNGAWNVYPFYPSGNVVISGIEQGLFIVKPNLPARVVGQLDFAYSLNDGSSGSGRQTFFADGSFDDTAGDSGTWSVQSGGRPTLVVQYGGGMTCEARLLGRVVDPGEVGGPVACQDGSGVTGTWSATIVGSTTLEALLGTR